MATKKKMLQAAAGNAGGAGAVLNVEDVFSTYLYEGNATSRSIVNGIDLADKGGLVWTKNRDDAYDHNFVDSVRGLTNSPYLRSNTTGAQGTDGGGITQFNSDGYTMGNSASWNANGNSHVSWTFAKAEKFFDIQTYTGDGTNNRKISHNLGSVPGCYIVKQINDGRSWNIYHRGLNNGNSPEDFILTFDRDAQTDADYWNDTAPTSTEFTINNYTPINESGGTYIAYLWAHNDGDGEFGPTEDQDIIKCGSLSLDSNGYTTVDLGFEPQWVMIKSYEYAHDWRIYDVQRGANALSGASTASGSYSGQELMPSNDDAESTVTDYVIAPNATGFSFKATGLAGAQYDGHIYIAIRRSTAVPESATEVFAISHRKNEIPSFPSGFPVDFLIGPRTINGTDHNEVKTRLISGGYLRTNTTDAENASSQVANFAHNDGFFNFSGANTNQYSWMWKRAPNYMDCVAYSGNGLDPDTRSLNHNLAAPVEMCWIKCRSTTEKWMVWHKDLTQFTSGGKTYGNSLTLNDNTAVDGTGIINVSETNATTLKLGFRGSNNTSGQTYIAYLFASLAGISKVGSVTQSGTTNVDCGFTSGARFVLLKRTDASGDWYFWDSERGIVSGNDPYLLLNSSAAQVAVQDYINPLSSGFTITSNFDFGDYIFYAIA